MLPTGNLVGVRFRRAGRVHFLATSLTDLQVGEAVVVSLPGGERVARVAVAPSQVLYHEVREPQRHPLRRATPQEAEGLTW